MTDLMEFHLLNIKHDEFENEKNVRRMNLLLIINDVPNLVNIEHLV